MAHPFRFAALALLAATAADSLWAQAPNTSGPPPWQDSASAYLSVANRDRQGASPPIAAQPNEPLDIPPYEALAVPGDPIAANVARPPADQTAGPQPIALPPTAIPTAPPMADPAVHHAAYESESNSPKVDQRRLLAPPSDRGDEATSQSNHKPITSRGTLGLEMPWESLTSTMAGLGIVVGLFLICAWLLRRGMRKSSAVLPSEVVSVLGRMPLAARQVAQLIRVGNKLVLVSMTPTGAETLTEVTDPIEVDRLVGLCQQHSPHSATRAFEQVFRQLSIEPTADGFLGQDSPIATPFPSIDTQRAYRGATVRA